jgi:hypothetical protein
LLLISISQLTTYYVSITHTPTPSLRLPLTTAHPRCLWLSITVLPTLIFRHFLSPCLTLVSFPGAKLFGPRRRPK